MTKPTAAQCHALTTYFVNKYNEVMGRAVVVNRNKAKWGFESILMDMTVIEAQALIDFYIRYYDKPSIDWFMYNYEKIVEQKQDHEKQEKSAAKRREITAARLEEWRNRWKNQAS